MRAALQIALWGALVTSTACGTLRGGGAGPETPAANGPLWKLPPDATVTLVEGGQKPLSELRGKVVLLDVWATWCGPCALSLPFYGKLYWELKDQGFEVVAISVDEDEAALREYLKKSPLPFLVAHDPQSELPERLGVAAMPTAFLMDRGGRIRIRHEGFNRSDEEEIRSQVMGLLHEGEPPPEAPAVAEAGGEPGKVGPRPPVASGDLARRLEALEREQQALVTRMESLVRLCDQLLDRLEALEKRTRSGKGPRKGRGTSGSR